MDLKTNVLLCCVFVVIILTPHKLLHFCSPATLITTARKNQSFNQSLARCWWTLRSFSNAPWILVEATLLVLAGLHCKAVVPFAGRCSELSRIISLVWIFMSDALTLAFIWRWHCRSFQAGQCQSRWAFHRFAADLHFQRNTFWWFSQLWPVCLLKDAVVWTAEASQSQSFSLLRFHDDPSVAPPWWTPLWLASRTLNA